VVVVLHVALPHDTEFGSLGAPPSGTGVPAPLLLLVPPSPPLLAPPSVAPLDVPPSSPPLLPPPPLLLLVPPLSSPRPPLELLVAPLLVPLPPLLPWPASRFDVPDVEDPLQWTSATGPATNRNAQPATHARVVRIERPPSSHESFNYRAELSASSWAARRERLRHSQECTRYFS
jgi:hypothetical protein